MKKKQPVFALFLLLALMIACGNGPTATVAPPEKDNSVGTINLVFSQVQAGPPDHLETLDGARNFYNGDGVRVTGGGKGKLDLNDGTRLILFNETELSGVEVSVSPKRSDFFLKQEGLLGHVPAGGRTTVRLPNGAKITILGTFFFVLYDARVEVATAGNFDGTVLYETPAGQERELQPGSMVEIPAQGQVTLVDIPFTRGEFEEAADIAGTPTGGLASLLKEIPPEPVTEVPVTEEPVKPLVPPLLLEPVEYADVGCPGKTEAGVFLRWQRPDDTGSISGYILLLEASDNNEFYGEVARFEIMGGDAIQYDISDIVDSTFTCTDYGSHYYRWSLQPWDIAGNWGPSSDWAYFKVSNSPVVIDASPPVFASIGVDPTSIITEGPYCKSYPRTTTVAAAIGDSSGLSEVTAYWHIGSVERGSVPLAPGELGYWAMIGPVKNAGTMEIYIYAVDTLGYSSQSENLYVTVRYCIE